ncbi:hypothetical protein JCM16358_11470 [Halanaerocella petrolearia]
MAYMIGVFIAIYIIVLMVNKKNDSKEDSRKNLKKKWKNENMDDSIEIINTEDVDQIINFLQEQAEMSESEGKDTSWLAGVGTAVFGPIAILAQGAKELINSSKWRGQGGKLRIEGYINNLEDYKEIKLEGAKKASEEKGSLKYTLGILKNKIPKLIDYRKEELSTLKKEEVISEKNYTEAVNNLEKIEECLDNEINYINSIIKERENMDQEVNDYHDKKEQIEKAYKRGYISEEDYKSKLAELKEKFIS